MVKLTMYIGGMIFGFGLAFSGATKPEIVLSFLRLEDLGLILVIGVALLVTLFTYQLVPRLLRKPPYGESFDGHDGFPVTSRTIVGAILFGMGWGIAGICPATSLASVGTGNWPLLYAIAGMFIGTFIYGSIRSRQLPTHK
ncbi:YeeE/YedE family protein [Candidatus Kaiserbacteria bacterium]|nr:YeeE/YedE family protein [Candidatus Kaiserbacteria bacterium]NCT01919.1 YeeE/YedE family protein [Candidatus Parcubacteria bacterium]